MEVKQSARRQAWSGSPATPGARFDIAPRTGYWDSDEWVRSHGRHAHVYVFAWHDGPDQRDPLSWEFHTVLETRLPRQKTIGLNVIRSLAEPVSILALASMLDTAL